MWLLFMVVGVLTGLGSVFLYELLKEQKIRFAWYHWLITVFWYLSGLFVIGFIGISIAEGEPRAAGMALLIFGGAFLVVSILLYRFVYANTVRPYQGKEEQVA